MKVHVSLRSIGRFSKELRGIKSFPYLAVGEMLDALWSTPFTDNFVSVFRYI